MIFSRRQVDNTLVEKVVGARQQTGCQVTITVDTNINKQVSQLFNRGAVSIQAATLRTNESLQRVRHSLDLFQLSVNYFSTQDYQAIGRTSLSTHAEHAVVDLMGC